MKKLVLILLILISLSILSPFLINTEDPYDIRSTCKFIVSSNINNSSKMFDGKLSTKWTSESGYQSITIEVPSNISDLKGIYIRWDKKPPAWNLTIPSLHDNRIIVSNDNPIYYAEWIPIPEEFKKNGTFLLSTYDTENCFSIQEISLYNFKIPYYVPQWKPYDGNPVDVMVIATHPDDENIYLGPYIPLTANAGKKSVTVFMTVGNSVRRIEAQESVWSMGGTICPVLRLAKDTFTRLQKDAIQVDGWSEEELLTYIVEQIRKYKPSVIATHDIDGESGHGAHILTSYIVRKAVNMSGDLTQYPNSLKQYGAWTPQKLYLHLYNENKIYFDIGAKLSAFDNLTAHQVIVRSYSRHYSQQRLCIPLQVHGSKCDMSIFGLYWTNPDLRNELIK